jgi:hypothetical protein
MRKVNPRKNKRAPLVVGPASSGEEKLDTYHSNIT